MRDRRPAEGRQDSGPAMHAAHGVDRRALHGMPWMHEALYLLEGRSRIGLTSERQLLQLLSWVDQRMPLGVPWCGLFVGHCLRMAMPNCPLPRFHMRGRPWLDWGEPAQPQLGAVMVFWHYHPKTPFGHVAFYWSEDAESYHVLGGNQRDRITIQRYPRERHLGTRWPTGLAQPRISRREPPEAALPFG